MFCGSVYGNKMFITHFLDNNYWKRSFATECFLPVSALFLLLKAWRWDASFWACRNNKRPFPVLGKNCFHFPFFGLSVFRSVQFCLFFVVWKGYITTFSFFCVLATTVPGNIFLQNWSAACNKGIEAKHFPVSFSWNSERVPVSRMWSWCKDKDSFFELLVRHQRISIKGVLGKANATAAPLGCWKSSTRTQIGFWKRGLHLLLRPETRNKYFVLRQSNLCNQNVTREISCVVQISAYKSRL